MRKIHLYILTGLIVCSCQKTPSPEDAPSSFDNGILCMNEGLFQQNNATLSFYNNDNTKTQHSLFSQINGRGLGDTANDMILYYYLNQPYIAIAVDVSSQIEIINAITLKSVKQIPLFNGTTARAPRHLEYFNQNLYSINFDGTVSVIDLSINSVTTTIPCGLNPDNSIIINNKLYVVNSGGLNSPQYDNSITVIDLYSQSVIETFETAINCSSIVVDQENEIYLVSRGNYGDVPTSLLRINSSTYETIETTTMNIGGIAIYQEDLLYYDYDQKGIYKINTLSEVNNNTKFIDCSNFENFYGLQIDYSSDLIYLIDANNYVTSSTVYSTLR